MPPIGTLLSHEKAISKVRLQKFLNGYLAYRHFRNQLWDRPGDYRLFKRLLEESWGGLAIQHFENDHGEARNEFSLLVRERRFTSEVSWHGHGLQAWKQTVWFLARTESSSTIVLDEPDVYLRADLQRKLIKLIESLEFKQSIIATHSSEIIGDVPFNHVTVVQKRERTSRPAAMADEIQTALRGMGSLHSIQLAKVAQHGLIFFVEGDDKPYLTDVAFKMGARKFDAFVSLAVQEIKGKGNWNYALGASKSLSTISSGEISVVLLLDRDFMMDEDRIKYYDRAKSEGLIHKIWERKEIENYFIDSAVVARYISERSDEPLMSDQVEELIVEIEKEMREDVELSFSDVIQTSTHPRIQSKTAVKRAKALVERHLQAGSKLRHLIGGKELISQLSGQCKSKFGVSFNALALCKATKLKEVPEEVVTLIEALTKPATLRSETFR